MRLGYVTAIFFDQNLEECLRFASAEGYGCVEVMCWPVGKAERKYAGVTHIDAASLTQAGADDINALCQKHGVSISGLGYYPNILSGNAEESRIAIAHLQKVMDAAKLLGLANVNTFIGNDHTKPFETNFARFKEVWPGLIQYAEERGLFIGIENCPMLFSLDEWPGGKNMAKSPAIWRKMFDAIPSRHFGLNYDPSHLVMQLMDYLQPIHDFRDRLFHVHAKDMKIERRKINEVGVQALPPQFSTPKIPGLGDVDWGAFISALSDAGYQGSLCVEVEDDAFRDDLAARRRSLRISRNVLRPLIG
jgi:sugar phosphate isomerase/epimerase